MRTIRQWRGEFGAMPPFDIGPDTLFVAYSAWAELTCFMQLGWQFPVHIFDLHTAFLAASNILLPYSPDEVRKRQSKRLPDACRAFGIEGWERIDKDSIAKDIGEGRWRDYGQDAVYEYCEEDVRMSARLLPRLLQGSNRFHASSTEHVLHWSNYSAKAIAQIQARGMPIDTYLWNLVQEHKPEIIRALIRRFDPSYGSDFPIYDEDGDRSAMSGSRRGSYRSAADLAAPGERSPRYRWRCLPPDVPHPRYREPTRAPRQSRRHRAREASDRRRRPQPP